MKTNKIRSIGLIFLLAVFTIMNLSCGGGGGSSSSSNMTDVSIKMIAATASDIAKLKFTISAPDMSTIERTVDVSGAQLQPYLQASLVSGDTVIVHFDVPNGLNRHVVVEALDASGAVIYIGDAYVDLDGTAKSIEITLNPPGPGQVVQCNDLTIAGGDTPETHTVELNQTSGTFNFLYETYGIADRMIVKYQGNTLYDSGCVTTVSTVSQTISYSGTSTQVIVEIQPNCSGTTTGTAWTFTVTCPTATPAPTPTPTPTPSNFQGSLSGTWSGTCSITGAESGTFAVNIDANGNVTGTFDGSDSGTVAGSVSGTGVMSASGTATGGMISTWDGTITRSGSTLTGNGTYHGNDPLAGTCSGTWNGSGTAL